MSAAETSRANVFRINALQVKENARKGPKLQPVPIARPPENGHREGWKPHS